MKIKRVLYIDDDKELLSLVAMILQEENIEVTTSPCALSPIEIFNFKPDLILLDEWLGDTEGSQICEQIRQMGALKLIPVVLISAVYQLLAIAAQCGATTFIAKPFNISELIAVVNSLI